MKFYTRFGLRVPADLHSREKQRDVLGWGSASYIQETSQRLWICHSELCANGTFSSGEDSESRRLSRYLWILTCPQGMTSARQDNVDWILGTAWRAGCGDVADEDTIPGGLPTRNRLCCFQPPPTFFNRDQPRRDSFSTCRALNARFRGSFWRGAAWGPNHFCSTADLTSFRSCRRAFFTMPLNRGMGIDFSVATKP